jgi:hypothetical protein
VCIWEICHNVCVMCDAGLSLPPPLPPKLRENYIVSFSYYFQINYILLYTIIWYMYIITIWPFLYKTDVLIKKTHLVLKIYKSKIPGLVCHSISIKCTGIKIVWWGKTSSNNKTLNARLLARVTRVRNGAAAEIFCARLQSFWRLNLSIIRHNLSFCPLL